MNYPQIKPTLNLDFSNTKTLDPRITFRRGTPGAYYDGKTHAKAEENLLSYSEDFSQWLNIRSDITASQSAPDGSSDAYKIAQASGETTACVSSIAVNMINGKNYVYSIYAKAGTNRNYLNVRIYDYSISDHYQYFLFDLGNGQALDNGDKRSDYYGGTHEIQDVGNNWYRCVVSFPVVNDSANGFLISNYVLGTPASTTAIVADDGGFIYVWGAQLEQRDVVTAYTPTNGAPITKYQPQLMFASPDQPRFDHDVLTGESKGLLIEESRTNLIRWSEDFAIEPEMNYYDCTIDDNRIVAPDGNLSADAIIFDDGTNAGLSAGHREVVSSGEKYTASIYAKAGNLSKVWLYFNVRETNESVNVGSSGIKYNLLTNTVDEIVDTNDQFSTEYNIFDVGNGWYRLVISATMPSNAGFLGWALYNYEDNVSSGKNTAYIWGAQLEKGSFPTSYIKTSGASATRSADNASITGENFSSWYRQDEGSFYSEALTYGDYIHRVLNFSDSTSNNRIVTTLLSSEQLLVKNNNNTEISIDAGSYNFNQFLKQGTGYKDDNFFVTIGGDEGSSIDKNDSTSGGSVPKSLNKLNIGCSESNSFYLNGHIKKLSYYPQRLTNEQLQQLTK